MHRCLQLAKLGAGNVAPNPMVGAVLVHRNRIIGEGWHQRYGEAHAEVNCINLALNRQAIQGGQTDQIRESALYVSLEPCVHVGKTPPCSDLIIQNKIPKVLVGCLDPFPEVNGKGIEKLRAAGIDVQVGILEKECREINKRFFSFHTLHRPYVVLKWAQTKDGFIAPLNESHVGTLDNSAKQRILISNEYSNRLAHKWRSEEAAILIGTNTAWMDDPELTTRLWPGRSPIRLVVDLELKLPSSLKIFNSRVKTIIFNEVKKWEEYNLVSYQITHNVSPVHQIMNALYQLKIQSVLVEGGARLLQSFIDEGTWDEAIMIRNSALEIRIGLSAPLLQKADKIAEQILATDKIEYYRRKDSES